VRAQDQQVDRVLLRLAQDLESGLSGKDRGLHGEGQVGLVLQDEALQLRGDMLRGLLNGRLRPLPEGEGVE
jgi:hypothetical protein